MRYVLGLAFVSIATFILYNGLKSPKYPELSHTVTTTYTDKENLPQELKDFKPSPYISSEFTQGISSGTLGFCTYRDNTWVCDKRVYK